MRTARMVLAVMALAIVVNPMPALATAFSTDQSDLWWNPSESGWGIQFIQRGRVIFATMYAYDADGNPTWYSATLYPVAGVLLIWSGDLYETSGPWYGTTPFNSSLVAYRKVGTMNWNGQIVETGLLNYTVDGVGVTKNLTRLFAGYDNFSGTYVGAVHSMAGDCADSSLNGRAEYVATLDVIQNGSDITLSTSSQGGLTCSFSGTLIQGGQFGLVDGTYQCNSGEIGNFRISEMNVGFNFLSARISTESNSLGCKSDGYLGGIRHR